MKKYALIKTIFIGIIGGTLPLLLFIANQEEENTHVTPNKNKISDLVIDGNRNIPLYNTNFNGSSSVDFREASRNSINSVVHVTTKVVHTSFQRDMFQEFFYGPGAGGREFKQFGEGAGSGVFISS